MVVGVRRRSSHRLLRPALFVFACVLCSTGAVRAGGGPRNVAVVINVNSSESRAIGEYYQAARGIPDANICNISCPTTEVVAADVFEARIREPIRQFLIRTGAGSEIDYIVLTKGIPLAADYGRPTSYGAYSTASILTAVDHPEILDWFAFPYGPIAPSRWTTAASESAWSHSTVYVDKITYESYHFYLVTRLDAYTVDQVKMMIDRGCHPAVDGIFALDKVPNVYPFSQGEYRYANLRLGTPNTSAYDYLAKRGFDVRFDSGTDFFANLRGVMGYFSWAIHDYQYTFGKYTSNLFVPGSIADTYWSFSGATFNDPGTTNRNPLIADLFACGLCGAGAYVSEPGINMATQPNILFDRYTKGYNMAESFYAACPDGFWKTVVIGDPLMAPYATPPEVGLNVGDGVFTGVVTIAADVFDESGVSRVVFYLDGVPIQTVTEVPFSIALDTNDYAIGTHTLEAVAYENSAVATQGSALTHVTIDNLVSTVDSIDHARDYADGQRVRLRTKVVTAGSAEIGDGFYIEERDRTSAIKVIYGGPVQRGDLVSVVGATATSNGERVLTQAVVESREPGEIVPGPLAVRLSDLGGGAVGDYTLPIGRGCGARNTSLLVRVVGVVTSVRVDGISITDASVACPIDVVTPPGSEKPSIGSWVIVTGLCEPHSADGSLVAHVRARDGDDIRVL